MIRKDEIVKAIHEGVFSAHNKYEEWSGGDWIGDFGVEGFLVSEISSKIREYQKDGEYICLELPFKDIAIWSGARKRQGRPFKAMRSRRRTDVVLLNKQEAPIHAIEVKRRWERKECTKDIDKLHSLVASLSSRHGGSLKSGFLVIYYSGPRKPHNTLEKRMKNAKEYICSLKLSNVKVDFHKKLCTKDSFVKRHERHGGKEWEYGSHIIELSRRYGKKA